MKPRDLLPSVDDITEKAKKIFRFEPEDTTEKALKERMGKKPIARVYTDEPRSLIPPAPLEEAPNGFAQSNVYESLLSEIKPQHLIDRDEPVRSLQPSRSYFEQVAEDDLSITQSEMPRRKAAQVGFWDKVFLTLGMVKFQHSIFALPFALTSVLVASQGRPGWLNVLLVIVAMITARNCAMTFNRIVDRHFDKKNPRTRDRAIPSGQLSLKFAVIFGTINLIAFIVIAGLFNSLTLALSPLALAIILGYSLTKRVTHYTQFYLGFALGCAPMAAWIAMTGKLAVFPAVLGLAVLFWVAGFDIIYATQDYEFDCRHKIKSLVVKYGIRRSLMMSRVIHVLAVISFVLAGALQGRHLFYYLGCLLTASLLAYEHSIIKPYDLSRVNLAFFTLNGYVSLLFFVFVLLDVILLA